MFKISVSIFLICHFFTLHAGEMNQNDLDSLLNELAAIQETLPISEKTVDFGKLLFERHFENSLSHLSFEEKKIKNISFKNLKFSHVNFKNALIETSDFQNVLFDDCDLFQARLIHSIFNKIYFTNCQMTGTEFNWSDFYKTRFIHDDLTASVFNNSSLRKVSFLFSKLSESMFFEAKVSKSALIDSDLRDCLLCGTKKKFYILGGTENKITRPVIGILYNFDERRTFQFAMSASVREHQGIVFKFYWLPKHIDTDLLDIEVKDKLLNYPLSNQKLTPAQFVLSDPKKNSEIDKIKDYIAKASKYINGLVIPGGDDVEPEFYGEERESETDRSPNYLRTMVEFSLIDSVHKLNIPTLGICRGIQTVNVFFGGTLEQDCPGHSSVYHLLELEEELLSKEGRKFALELLQGKNIRVLSKHHQACKKIGVGLEVILHHENRPEFIQSLLKNKDKYPNFTLTQFHPELGQTECYKDQDLFHNNSNFFKKLVEYSALFKN